MKIGLNGYCFGSTKDRVSQYATFTVQALVESNPASEFVLFVARKPKIVLPKNCTVVVIEASGAASRTRWEKKVMTHTAFQTLDFFHSFQPSEVRSKSVATGITFHSTLALKPKKYFWQTWQQRSKLSSVVKNSSLIITVTDVLRREISHFFSLPLDRIRVVPGAVNTFFQKPPELQTMKEVQKTISKGHDFLMYVGKVRKTSNIANVLAAFAQVISEPRFSKLKLIITGRTPFHRDPLYVSEGELAKTLQELGIKSSVLMSGPLKQEQLRAMYKITKGVICDTTDLGFPVSAFEAALAGAPMVIPNSQSYTEFFGGDFLRYDIKNPKSLRLALAILADPTISQTEQIVKAQMTAHSYSWQEASESLMRTIAETVEKKSQNR